MRKKVTVRRGLSYAGSQLFPRDLTRRIARDGRGGDCELFLQTHYCFRLPSLGFANGAEHAQRESQSTLVTPVPGLISDHATRPSHRTGRILALCAHPWCQNPPRRH